MDPNSRHLAALKNVFMEEVMERQNRVQIQPLSQEETATKSLRFLAEHSTCAMCDSDLEIKHDINKKELKVKEEAHCPLCGIRVRSTHHLMH
jgi:DNA-directed RNA polymerase subunit RPC12/RpoP